MGAAVLYLLLPYTSMMTGRVMHVLPAALLIWAVVFYRRPEVAGGFLGFAMGAVYYPFFLLPLWIGFYWQRGLARFAVGVALSLTLVVLSLVFTTSDMADFWEQVRRIFGIMIPRTQGLEGFWQSLDVAYRVYRFPVLAAFIGILPGHGALARTKESGHADQFVRHGHAGHAVLDGLRWRLVLGVVHAARAADDLSAQSGGPSRIGRVGRFLAGPPPSNRPYRGPRCLRGDPVDVAMWLMAFPPWAVRMN